MNLPNNRREFLATAATGVTVKALIPQTVFANMASARSIHGRRNSNAWAQDWAAVPSGSRSATICLEDLPG